MTPLRPESPEPARAAPYCQGCGRRECSGCLPELDPPRYCGRCGAWLATAVTPAGWKARCRNCGPTRSGS